MYTTIYGEKRTMGVPRLAGQRFIGVGKSLATFCGRYRGARATWLGGSFDICILALREHLRDPTMLRYKGYSTHEKGLSRSRRTIARIKTQNNVTSENLRLQLF